MTTLQLPRRPPSRTNPKQPHFCQASSCMLLLLFYHHDSTPLKRRSFFAISAPEAPLKGLAGMPTCAGLSARTGLGHLQSFPTCSQAICLAATAVAFLPTSASQSYRQSCFQTNCWHRALPSSCSIDFETVQHCSEDRPTHLFL